MRIKNLVIAGAIPALACALACQAPGATVESAAAAEPVAARIGETEITLSEVDEIAVPKGIQQFQGVYDTRRLALDELIAEALLEQEAAARGVSRDELVQTEVGQRIRQVTEQDIIGFYEGNKNRMQGMELEQVRPQIVQYLTEQFATLAQRQFLLELKNKSDVEITLDPPRIPVIVAGNDPVRGPANAKITIVEYSDFQ